MIFLTQMQISMIEFIKEHRKKNDLGPSRALIRDFLGYESADRVRSDLETLIDAGYLRKNDTGLFDIEVIAEPGDEVKPVSNCRSTQLLQEVFSQTKARASMSPYLRDRVTAHLKAIALGCET